MNLKQTHTDHCTLILQPFLNLRSKTPLTTALSVLILDNITLGLIMTQESEKVVMQTIGIEPHKITKFPIFFAKFAYYTA